MFRFDCKRFEVWVHLFEETAHAGNRSTCANARHNGVNLMSTVFPDFRSCSRFVNRWVGGILKLLRHESVVGRANHFMRPVDGPFHAFTCGC